MHLRALKLRCYEVFMKAKKEQAGSGASDSSPVGECHLPPGVYTFMCSDVL